MTTPAVTFLMTVHNGMPYLPETVESALAQSFADFRLVIIDNASTDGTAAYLAGLTDRRVRLGYDPTPGGRTVALNRGLAGIDTEFTAVLDADDLAAPRRLERQVAFLRANPDTALVGSDIRYINRRSEVVGSQRYPARHEELLADLPLRNPFAHSACAFRTAEARAVGGYPEEYAWAQDFGLWLALLQRGCRVANIPEFLADIRIHPAQTTRDAAWSERRLQDELKLDRAMIGLPGLTPWTRQAARLRLALTLRSLGRNSEALAELGRGLREAPLFFLNPVLWRRLLLMARRRAFPLKTA